jgi:outer membrane protein
MRRIQQSTALLSIALLISPLASAQMTEQSPNGPITGNGVQVRTNSGIWPGGEIRRPTGRWAWLTGDYSGATVPGIQLGNTSRLDQLMRGGNIYLSMQDAIALALENNIDVELQRYGRPISEANLLRANAGGILRGSTPSVLNGPSSATGNTPSGSNFSGTSTGAQGTGPTSTSISTASVSSGQGGASSISFSGTPLPALDPFISASGQYQHITSPQSNTIVTGTTSYIRSGETGSANINKAFLTGTSVSLGYSDQLFTTNSFSDIFNPSRTASLTASITQPLLQGFGRSVNGRYIAIAKNNLEAADLNFRLQVITTVTAVENLYWDLVSFMDDVKAKQEALAYSQRLYEDNKKQVEIGTLAPIEIVRAEAQVASSQSDLIVSQTRVLQQETTLKSYLSRTGVANPLIAAAHIIPTDRIRIPDIERIQPFQDLVTLALSSRPELAENRINVTNAKISLRGSRNGLLPTLNLFGSWGSAALAGQPNTIPVPGNAFFRPGTPNDFFTGGYGTVLGQLFGRSFPNYSAGVSLNIPLRNRAARADYVLDQVALRQQELTLARQENQVRVEVQNAIIGLQQARASYDSAVKARILQEQTLDAENKKLKLGASTVFNVIQVQRDLATAQSNEVAALSNYSKARVEMDRATGQVLINSNVSVEQAYRGKMDTPPATLPPA